MHVFEGAAEALAPVRRKLKRGEPIVVAAVGGSITAGAMLAGQPTYMQLFRDWLQRRFPTAVDGGDHTYVNLGYHAHDSQVRCAPCTAVSGRRERVLLRHRASRFAFSAQAWPKTLVSSPQRPTFETFESLVS
jgi:hypothetical protein